MKIKTFRGQVPMGLQNTLHLSTSDGLTGYRIHKFEIISTAPGVGSHAEVVAKIFSTSQTTISGTIDFNDTDLLAAVFYQDRIETGSSSSSDIILDRETFNQDIFVTMEDIAGATVPFNFYIELEQFKIDLNASTFHTLKNIRSRTQTGI